ncbi:avidin/streptavidin family protein [Xanthomonas translucens]|nr:avidin/streptavidin family protein [Xanthomonas translucens]KTF39451.1 autotransporter [Xanthomonas translucens pv. translucens]KWV13059.1 autotransporter [Xanthomonas translucens]MCC8446063.1 avidin/streptavidin family protein [Xanthomonas translucens pv. translucens]MCS3361881.1 avidin/streptavidin family protein [Xanthomonas translucens pv. translucens]MCS3375420.1 avidin/streptavidin family protein [Xanthomonas translucens pv. translucens]
MMSMHMRRYAACVALLAGCVSLAQAAPTCSNPVGDWGNQLGSTLRITAVQPSGQLSGTYTSPSGTTGSAYPLIGWFTNPVAGSTASSNLPAITFSVQWGSYGSMTAWVGTCDPSSGVPTITTVWHLARTSSQYSWDHLLTNSDVFVPK